MRSPARYATWTQPAALTAYHRDVQRIEAFGTPMDTALAPDSEGILGFIRGARVMHQQTGEAQYLEMLDHGLRYEYLWRYAYRARP